MDFISKVNLVKLAEIVQNARNQLFLCLPSIPKIVSDSIIRANEDHPNIEIKLLVDFDPQTFRQGYGEFQAFEDLRNVDIPISTLADNRISFVICDGIGYYLFIESQYLVPAEKETYNAIEIDCVSMVKLKQHFFGTSKGDYTNELSNAIIEVHQELKRLDETKMLPPPLITNPITDTDQKKIKENIDRNPPLKPDHKRILDVYTNKFQYVDVTFSEVNIRNKEVKIPQDLLPLMDDSLRNQLNTTIRAIDKETKLEDLDELIKLKNDLNEIRNKYLTHSKYCNKNILKIGDKESFLISIEKISAKIPKLRQKIAETLYNESFKTETKFKEQLYNYLIAHPEKLFPKNSQWINNENAIQRAALNKIESNKIHWPHYHELLDRMDLKTLFSDITIEDLKNKELLKEFAEKGIISNADANELAVFNKSILANPEKNKS